MNNAAAEFLCRHGMHPDCIPMAESCGRFLLEMKQGLKGEPSSLMMIPAYVSPEHQLPKDASVAVLDAGGTNLRSGRCRVSGGNITLEQVQVCPMPGTVSPLSTEEFLETLADQLEPVLKDCAGLGFCFSLPAESRTTTSLLKPSRMPSRSGVISAGKEKQKPRPAQSFSTGSS